LELILLFILSGAVSWGLSALLLLAFLHALTRAMAAHMGVPDGGKPGSEAPS
jgi:hypothetical protein